MLSGDGVHRHRPNFRAVRGESHTQLLPLSVTSSADLQGRHQLAHHPSNVWDRRLNAQTGNWLRPSPKDERIDVVKRNHETVEVSADDAQQFLHSLKRLDYQEALFRNPYCEE
jgi:hypothetical protein